MATIRFVSGLVTQRQTVGIPAGIAVSAPDCRLDPGDCCASGGAAGCCVPPPPATLYAARYGADPDCGCLDVCVVLVYVADLDAWYGSLPGCGADPAPLLRLKCVEGAYALDVVGAEDAVVLAGSPSADVTASCDPFLGAWDFVDDAGDVCSGPGGFGYLISEADCSPGSGSGGGGTAALGACCPAVPLTLTGIVTLRTGAFLGAPEVIACEYDGVSQWHVTTPGWLHLSGCVNLACLAGSPYFGTSARPGWSCEPFTASFDLNDSLCLTPTPGTCRVTFS